jgi:magnesium-transporting ATPase (P-type)
VIVLIGGLAIKDASGESIYPMSALQILFLNMVSSTPPALGLGAQEPPQDIMDHPPPDQASQIFSKEILMDTAVYGTIMGVLSLWDFLFVTHVLHSPYISAVRLRQLS